jgi:hypothetical protein
MDRLLNIGGIQMRSDDRMSRRSLIGTILSGTGAFAGILFGQRAYAQAKISQKSVAYQPQPKGGQSCANCNLFQPPANCKTVEGPVSAQGWCKIWVKKP